MFPDDGTEIVPSIVCHIALWQCQYVKFTDTAARSGSVSKLVFETGWDHFKSRSPGILSARMNLLGVRAWRILIPIHCVTWWCKGWFCRVRVTSSIVWVSVSSLYSKPWARVTILGPSESSPALFRCRSVSLPISGSDKGFCWGVFCVLSASLIKLQSTWSVRPLDVSSPPYARKVPSTILKLAPVPLLASYRSSLDSLQLILKTSSCVSSIRLYDNINIFFWRVGINIQGSV